MPQATEKTTTPLRNVDPIELRAKMSKAVDRLLAALDALDAVTEDLEDGDNDGGTVSGIVGSVEDDEPELGWTLTNDQTARQFHGNGSDLEHEHDGAEPDVDAEPSLGASEPNEPDPGVWQFWGSQVFKPTWNAFDQRWWTHGCNDKDGEAEHDGAEPDSDFEPNADQGDYCANAETMNPDSNLPRRI